MSDNHKSGNGVTPVRVGVFICHCGTNISKTVDVMYLAEKRRESRVVHSIYCGLRFPAPILTASADMHNPSASAICRARKVSQSVQHDLA